MKKAADKKKAAKKLPSKSDGYFEGDVKASGKKAGPTDSKTLPGPV